MALGLVGRPKSMQPPSGKQSSFENWSWFTVSPLGSSISADTAVGPATATDTKDGLPLYLTASACKKVSQAV